MPHPDPPKLDRRGLSAVVVLFVVAYAASRLSPVPPPWVERVPPDEVWVPPIPGGPGLAGSALMLLPAIGLGSLFWRFGRNPWAERCSARDFTRGRGPLFGRDRRDRHEHGSCHARGDDRP